MTSMNLYSKEQIDDKIPPTTGASVGDVLTVGSSGTEWSTPSTPTEKTWVVKNTNLDQIFVRDSGIQVSLIKPIMIEYWNNSTSMQVTSQTVIIQPCNFILSGSGSQPYSGRINFDFLKPNSNTHIILYFTFNTDSSVTCSHTLKSNSSKTITTYSSSADNFVLYVYE